MAGRALTISIVSKPMHISDKVERKEYTTPTMPITIHARMRVVKAKQTYRHANTPNPGYHPK